MNDLNEINDNINELIMSKSFDQLTEEERAKALEYAGSEEGYNNLRQTLMAITSSFHDETDEDFAGDEMKSDLMSQFEKRYGTGRTKVVPLYRKPYFQLAVAASLALLVFFSIPVFRHSEKNNIQLAKAENTGKETETGKDRSITLDGNTNVTRPETGTGVTEDERTAVTVNDEPPAEETTPAVNADRVSALEAERQQEKKNLWANNQEKDRADDETKETYSFNSSPPPPGISNSDNQKTVFSDLESEENTSDKKAIPSKLAELKKEEKEKNSSKDTNNKRAEYTHPKSDHTHHHEERMNEMASGAVSISSKNTSSGVAGFVEQNKTQMMDLLFTVY